MERCSEVILDSSVMVKWFSREVKSDEALKFLDSYLQGSTELVVSDILFCEVGNALRYKSDYDTQTWKIALAQLFNLRMKVVQLDEALMNRAGEIAFQGQVTIYDALPVAIAENKKTVCITADEQTQYKKLKTKGFPIELL